jgi:hypothetical protein
VGKKNISKKQSDVMARKKEFLKSERRVDRDLKKKQDFELRQMQKNKKNGIT